MKGRREDPETTGGVSVRRNNLKRRSTSLTDMSEHPEIRRRHNTFLIKQAAPPTWFRRMALSKCGRNTGTCSFKAGPVFDEDVDSGFSELQVMDEDCKDPPPVTPKRGHNASTADQRLSIRKELHKVKKGKKYCKGCGQYKNIECFECNQVLDMICKRAVNNITNLAKRQGAEDWLKEQLSSEETMQAIIRAYNDRSGVDELTGKTGKTDAGDSSPFKLATYRLAIQCAQEVFYDSEGIMMHETQYIEEAMTNIALGRLSSVQARAKWEEIKANIAENPGSLIHDDKGPDGSTSRIRIASGQSYFQKSCLNDKGARSYDEVH